MSAGATVFFGLWLQKPMRIAAANPSGRRFADALARCVKLDRPGAVLELGAGTIKQAPEMHTSVDTSFITGIGSVNDRMLILMDIEGLMTSADMGLINSAPTH